MKKTILKYISLWEKRCYEKGIPEEVPTRIFQLNKAPSYKAIALAIMKNDTVLKTLGYTRKKCKHYHLLKRIELKDRNLDIQYKLFK